MTRDGRAAVVRFTAAAVIPLLVFLASAPVGAASQRPLTLEQMVDLSQEIVVGRVITTEARWQSRLIVTVATVEVEEAIKGEGLTRVEIVQLGGAAVHPETGLEVTMSASTQVALEPGEDLLLFVHRTTTGLRQLVGAQQGRYVIRRNADTGTREIPIGPKRLEVHRGADGDTVTTEVMTLDVMRERIHTHMDRPPIRGRGNRQ